ncbi:MAG TPA: GNAT family N-acetyltransferase [Firmicutes bacterium]|nr:GNAT family N-acetyltransferase [Bacillota bacterium]
MINKNLAPGPSKQLPPGFRLRFYQQGERAAWARITTQAGEFAHVSAALERFQNEFGPKEAQLPERCLFLENDAKIPIGTAIGWYGRLRSRLLGRLHWVAIIPAYQGLGLARPLISRAINVMAKFHTKAYLTTGTGSFKGIKLYLDYGFKPLIETEKHKIGWRRIEKILNIDLGL